MRWPWSKRRQEKTPVVEEVSTLDRLLTRNCTRDEFLLLYAKLLAERFPDVVIAFVGETTFQLTNAEGKQGTAYLDNLWLLYEANSEGRGELLERYIRMVGALFESAEPPSREAIVAMVKDATYLSQAGAAELITEHIAGDLWIVYGVDLPDRISTVSPKKLTESGIDRGELRALAVDNLRRILPPVERHDADSWFWLSAGGDYTASLLLFEEMWRECADDMHGSLVAAAPARDVLLVTSSESLEGIAALRARAASIAATGDHVISETLLVWSGEQWTVFKVN